MDIEPQDNFEEVIETIKPVLSLDLENEELITEIDKNISKAKEVWKTKTLEDGEKNYIYYLGKEEVKLGQDQKTKIIENIIFMNTETIIPIITSSTPEPRIFHPN